MILRFVDWFDGKKKEVRGKKLTKK